MPTFRFEDFQWFREPISEQIENLQNEKLSKKGQRNFRQNFRWPDIINFYNLFFYKKNLIFIF